MWIVASLHPHWTLHFGAGRRYPLLEHLSFEIPTLRHRVESLINWLCCCIVTRLSSDAADPTGSASDKSGEDAADVVLQPSDVRVSGTGDHAEICDDDEEEGDEEMN